MKKYQINEGVTVIITRMLQDEGINALKGKIKALNQNMDFTYDADDDNVIIHEWYKVGCQEAMSLYKMLSDYIKASILCK